MSVLLSVFYCCSLYVLHVFLYAAYSLFTSFCSFIYSFFSFVGNSLSTPSTEASSATVLDWLCNVLPPAQGVQHGTFNHRAVSRVPNGKNDIDIVDSCECHTGTGYERGHERVWERN